MTGSAPAVLPSSLVLVGAGKMGGAMLEGWLGVGLAPSAVTVVDPQPSQSIRRLCAERGIRLDLAPSGQPAPDALVLAVKPQSLEEAAPSVAPLIGSETLLVSILAGKTVADLCGRLPSARAVVRAMPNLPASVGRGATGAFATTATTARQKAMAGALLASVGIVEWLDDEALVDAVTALSGSGPAYVFYLTECLARAGAALGLPAALAERLARATVSGAGELLRQSDLPPETLRRNVTSPGGTTAAALEVLMAEEPAGESRLQALMREAVAAAKRRAGELSG